MDLEFYDDENRLDAKHQALVKELVAFCGDALKKPDDTEMSITIVSDDEIQRINREYRQTDRVTDVISFAIEDGEDDLPDVPGLPENIGYLFIDQDKVLAQSKD